jgi:hypothetical protein
MAAPSVKWFRRLNGELVQGILTVIIWQAAAAFHDVAIRDNFKFTTPRAVGGRRVWMRNLTHMWQQAVQEAIAERDPNELERKIQLAEVAIFERIDTFSAADSGEDVALFQALGKLQALRENYYPHKHHSGWMKSLMSLNAC